MCTDWLKKKRKVKFCCYCLLNITWTVTASLTNTCQKKKKKNTKRQTPNTNVAQSRGGDLKMKKKRNKEKRKKKKPMVISRWHNTLPLGARVYHNYTFTTELKLLITWKHAWTVSEFVNSYLKKLSFVNGVNWEFSSKQCSCSRAPWIFVNLVHQNPNKALVLTVFSYISHLLYDICHSKFLSTGNNQKKLSPMTIN